MSSGKNTSKIVATCTERQQAVPKYVTQPITVIARLYTPPEIDAVYQKCIDTRTALKALRGQVNSALLARKQADAEMEAFDEGMKAHVVVTYGPTSQAAVDFGYEKKPKTKVPVAEKAAAAVKAKATRVARGTQGPKAKLAITGAAEPATAEPPTAAPLKPTA